MGIDVSDVKRFGAEAQAQIASKLTEGFRAQAAEPRKYHNKPTERNGIQFDSKKEARRYDELMLLLGAGEIRNLKLQPQFTLQEGFRMTDGTTVRAMRYTADFSYERPTLPDAYGNVYWIPVVEDVKSTATRTAEYKRNYKMFAEKYGFRIKEV